MKVGAGGRAGAARRAIKHKPSQMAPEQMVKKVKDILEHHQPLPIPADVEARLKEIVAEADERHKQPGI